MRSRPCGCTYCFGGTTYDNCVLDEVGIHASPVVCLLSTHRKAANDVEFAQAEVLCEELVLRIYAVAIVKGLGEIGRVGRRTGFAVAEHGDDDDVV